MLSKSTRKELSVLVIFEMWQMSVYLITWLYLPTAKHIETLRRKLGDNGKYFFSRIERNRIAIKHATVPSPVCRACQYGSVRGEGALTVLGSSTTEHSTHPLMV